MIQIREVFRIYPERMKDAIDLAREAKITGIKYGLPIDVSTELSAEFYSLVFEIKAGSFDEYLSINRNIHATDEWQAWYVRFRVCIIKGKRELFTVIE